MTGRRFPCPVCGSVGEIRIKTTPHTAGIGWNAPGTCTAWIICPLCGFEGRHAVVCLDERAAAQFLRATIGTAEDAIERAGAHFTEGRAVHRPEAVRKP